MRNTLAIVGAGAIVLHGARLLLKLFGPNLPYGMPQPPNEPLDSKEFVRFLSITTNAAFHRDTKIEVLLNGNEFYPAELDVIRGAQKNVNLLFYEFVKGDVADQFIEALTERARAGVDVKLVVDAMGSFGARDSYFDGLRAAGGQMVWYHALGWDTWTHMDNRTHRKVMTADGEIGFIGGAGVADHWMKAGKWGPAWRDTMLRVEGSAVAGLVSVFSENWLECSGEMLSGAAQFPLLGNPGQATALVINSTPHGGSTRARTLFQTLLDCARHSIRITTPYFLPDRSALHALVRAMHKRNVSVQILTAGPGSDHPSTARLSEALALGLLKSGAEIYEYQPGMIHAKLMTIDGMWSVAGSTNFDHRSFALNDEVNLAVLDPDLAASLDRDFTNDLARSLRRTVQKSMNRSMSVRVMNNLGWLVRREE
ncbi:MAG: phospholipase D-like domain-containing protein [Bryobacteraceae bacterium]